MTKPLTVNTFLLASTDVLFLGQHLGVCCVVNPILPSVNGFLLAFVVDTQFGGGRALPKYWVRGLSVLLLFFKLFLEEIRLVLTDFNMNSAYYRSNPSATQ